jgi:Cof subfamily protein (haloacid dehalogenase superfamily)
VSEIKLLLSDVDGTLVRRDKSLAPSTVDAVQRLHDAGIHFAVTSGRPPRGMEMLVEPLTLRGPLAGFNGGLVVEPDMEVLEQHAIADELVPTAIRLLEESGLVVWAYRGNDWYVRDQDGLRVDRESHTLQFAPTVVEDFDTLGPGVAKIVGVSDDLDAVATAQRSITDELGDRVSAATSQPYYLDITHPRANKGAVVEFLSRRYAVPHEDIATIGDGRNDILMFARSGLSIAMGNAHLDVQRAARHVTTTNEDDGFANAVDRYILGHAGV